MKNTSLELLALLKKHSSILDCIDEVETIKISITDSVKQTVFINQVREIVQEEAVKAVINAGGRGLVILPTGGGKSKVAINLATHYATDDTFSPGLIVPTEKLRDENWKEEIEKWNAEKYFKRLQSLCYASGSKVQGLTLDLLILDEVHRTTDLSSEFFQNNKIKNVLALTATYPTEENKIELLRAEGIEVVYEVTLDQAVRFGFVAPYKITIVTVPLNSVDKNVAAGNKAAPFFQSEKAAYEYASSNIEKCKPLGGQRLQFAILKRMHLIYGLKSKTDVIKYLLDKVIPKEDRSLLFCSNIKQADEVCKHSFHSKSKGNSYDLFKRGEVNKLSCVKALDEGVNFVALDSAIISQLNSKERGLVQRIGRLIRYRPGHEAHIWIIIAKDTQDEVWLQSAIENLDKAKIDFITFSNLKTLY